MFQYITIETDRTTLNVLTLAQTEDVYHHFSDLEVIEFMDIGPCRDMKAAEEIIQYHINDTGCRWGIFSKEDNQFIGTCGFHYIRKKEVGIVVEIGFDLAKNYWGKGIMTEVLTALIHFGFKNLNLQMIDATVDPRNHRSLTLMEKLGFQRHVELQDNLVYFSLENDDCLIRSYI